MTLSGSRAPHGIDYGALDSFLGHFSSALRDLDRSERGVAPGKPGAPEAAASAATSLRIVSITPGSAIIELEPLRSDGEDRLALDDPPRSRLVIDRLIEGVASGAQLPAQVVDALNKARRSCGEDGAFALSTAATSVTVDKAAIDRLSRGEPTPEVVSSVGGWLRQVAAAPDQALISAPDGTEWRASFPPELEESMRRLWLRPVVAEGTGRRTGSARGTFDVASIRETSELVQTVFFSTDHRPVGEVLADQGIMAPQGLAALVNDAPVDEADVDAFLAAIFDDEQ